MRLTDPLRFARDAALGTPLRTALSVLAMSIGVAAVVILTALGDKLGLNPPRDLGDRLGLIAGRREWLMQAEGAAFKGNNRRGGVCFGHARILRFSLAQQCAA